MFTSYPLMIIIQLTTLQMSFCVPQGRLLNDSAYAPGDNHIHHVVSIKNYNEIYHLSNHSDNASPTNSTQSFYHYSYTEPIKKSSLHQQFHQYQFYSSSLKSTNGTNINRTVLQPLHSYTNSSVTNMPTVGLSNHQIPKDVLNSRQNSSSNTSSSQRTEQDLSPQTFKIREPLIVGVVLRNKQHNLLSNGTISNSNLPEISDLLKDGSALATRSTAHHQSSPNLFLNCNTSHHLDIPKQTNHFGNASLPKFPQSNTSADSTRSPTVHPQLYKSADAENLKDLSDAISTNEVLLQAYQKFLSERFPPKFVDSDVKIVPGHVTRVDVTPLSRPETGFKPVTPTRLASKLGPFDDSSISQPESSKEDVEPLFPDIEHGLKVYRNVSEGAVGSSLHRGIGYHLLPTSPDDSERHPDPFFTRALPSGQGNSTVSKPI